MNGGPAGASSCDHQPVTGRDAVYAGGIPVRLVAPCRETAPCPACSPNVFEMTGARLSQGWGRGPGYLPCGALCARPAHGQCPACGPGSGTLLPLLGGVQRGLVLTAACECAITAQDEVRFFFKSEHCDSDIHIVSELCMSASKFKFKIIFIM